MRLTRVVMSLLLLPIALGLLFACGKKEENGAQAAFNNTLFLAGSSTLAPTISQLAELFRQEYQTWDQVDSSLPAGEIQISVATGGSGAGARAVLDGTANFGMLARAAREAERDALSDYRELKVGIDALMIAVHRDNPLAGKRTDLTAAEVRRIFSGEISRWHELDPELPNEEIVLLVRDVGGGAHGVFQNTVMERTDVSDRAVQVPSMSGLVTRLAGNRQAIGYASYGVAEAHRDQLAVFSLDGVAPTEDNIMSGSYPVSRPLVLIWNGELSTTEQAFLNYLSSPIGARIIGEMGFLPLI